MAFGRNSTEDSVGDSSISSQEDSDDADDFESVKVREEPEVLAFAPGQAALQTASTLAAKATTAAGGGRARRASLVGDFGGDAAAAAAAASKSSKKGSHASDPESLFGEPETGLEMCPCQYGPGPANVASEAATKSSAEAGGAAIEPGDESKSPTDFLRPRPPPQTRPRLARNQQLRFRRIVQAAVGGDHVLCVDEAGVLLCGGADGSGQTGLAAAGAAGAARRTSNRSGNQAQAVRLDMQPNTMLSKYTLTKRKVAGIAAGSVHSTAIGEEGGLWAWGMAGGGRLGVAPMAGALHDAEDEVELEEEHYE